MKGSSAMPAAAAEVMTMEPARTQTAAPTGVGRPSSGEVLRRLGRISEARSRLGLAARLADLADFVGQDLEVFERALATIRLEEEPGAPWRVGLSTAHLLGLGGKRLRPMLVALASRLGSGFSEVVLDLAVAVELVHSATLLHDDVVDLSETRRGAATARAIYGNAASIFGGDWLLIEALRRVERCRLPGLLVGLFDLVEEMIHAESLQLESRGRVDAGRDVYFRIVEGKTAAVFRWAVEAGALAGELDDEARRELAAYGLQVGVAFQAIDDLLDLTGDVAATGKAVFTDLREGKMTLPLIYALERDTALAAVVGEILAEPPDAPIAPAAAERVVASLHGTGAVADCRGFARESVTQAIRHLDALPESRARRGLVTVAEAIVDRDR